VAILTNKRPQNPAEAWQALLAGNQRFVQDTREHPNQDVDRRAAIASAQVPFAALFGCSDSRLSAEIIFDVGLGDLFVVRNAGQVIAETILGSLEYAVEVLKVPLILVLGHDQCGAVRAAIDATEGNLAAKGHFIQHIVAAIQPTVTHANSLGRGDIDGVTELHIQDTINDIQTKSKVISDAIKAGSLGIVGANYELSGGEVHRITAVGNV
jgi:carbonic anhydrase